MYSNVNTFELSLRSYWIYYLSKSYQIFFFHRRPASTVSTSMAAQGRFIHKQPSRKSSMSMLVVPVQQSGQPGVQLAVQCGLPYS